MIDVGHGSMPPGVHGNIPAFARVKNNIALKTIRRKLRSSGTPAEAALWNILKGRKVGGFRFRRQFSVGAYVLDFYCPLLQLAIELDGDYHYHGAMPEKDYSRMQKLEHEHGIKTLRFENKVVFENPNGIVAEVMRYAAGHTPPPLRGTSPVSGEELLSVGAAQQVACVAACGRQSSRQANSPSKIEGVAEGRGSMPPAAGHTPPASHTPPPLRGTSPVSGEELKGGQLVAEC